MDDAGNRLDRSGAAAALKAKSILRLAAVLDALDLGEDHVAQLIGLMERCGHLFFRVRDVSREAARDHFLEEVEGYLSRRVGVAGAGLLAPFRELVRQVEGGYADVAHGLANAAVSSLPRDRRLIAVLRRAGNEWEDVRRRALAALAGATAFTGHVFAKDDDGREFDVDEVTSAQALNLGSFLTFWSEGSGERRTNGKFVFPVPTEVTDEELFKAGTSLASARAYRHWRRTEERRRFWGGELLEHRPPHLPEGAAPTIEVIREYRPEEAELLDLVANERLRDLLMKEGARARAAHGRRAPATRGGAASATEEYVSAAERAAFNSLTTLLALDPDAADEAFQGLTLAEWVRGYAVLGLLAEEAYGIEPTSGSRSLRILAVGELEGRLRAARLGTRAVDAFVGHATFGPGRADLFDRPLLLLDDGRRLLYAPGAIDVDITRAVLSNLGALREPFEGKGAGFNRTVLRFFEGLGLKPFTLDRTRDGERYQFDVLLPWDDHLFLFECKNEMLSENSPVSAHNFETSRRRHVAQALRQADGLARHPDMIIEAAGFDPGGMRLVTSLLYALPYASPDRGESVFVTDWSSLTRFFARREVTLATSVPMTGGEAAESSDVHVLWEGERPTPADLVRQLEDPIQVGHSMRRITLHWDQFWLSDHRVAAVGEWRRRPGAAQRDVTG